MRYFLDFWVQVYLVSLSSFPGSSMMQVPAFHFLWLNKYFMAGVWSVDGHLGCSHFLAVGNTVGNIHTQASLSLCFFVFVLLLSLPLLPSFLSFSLSFFHYIEDIKNIYVLNVQWYFMILICISLHSSILAQKIPWTVEPGRLQSMGSQSQTQLSNWVHTHEMVNV